MVPWIRIRLMEATVFYEYAPSPGRTYIVYKIDPDSTSTSVYNAQSHNK